jgi:subfamily B ATP-binding cassette protein MsbA
MTDLSQSKSLYPRLLSYVLPYKFSFLLSVLGFIMYASAAPLLAEMMGLIEETLQNPVQEMILFIVFAQIGIFAFRGVGTFLGKYFIGKVGSGVVHDMRTQLFNIL